MIDHQQSYFFGEMFVFGATGRLKAGKELRSTRLAPSGRSRNCVRRVSPRLPNGYQPTSWRLFVRCVARNTSEVRRSGQGDPDLFMYHPDGRVKFVEVKKQADRIHPPQLTCLAQIIAILGYPVEIVYLREQLQPYSQKTYVLDLELFQGQRKT